MTAFGTLMVVFGFVLGILFGIKIQYVINEYHRAKEDSNWAGHKKLRELKRSHGDEPPDEGSRIHTPLSEEQCKQIS